MVVAAVTGLGGGTLRDLLLGRAPVFWLRAPELLAVCAVAALLVFATAHLVESRFRALLWADAVGLSLFAVTGAETALIAGADPWAAALLGVVSACFGGIVRDVVCAEVPLILRREIYLTAAGAGAAAFVLLRVAAGAGRETAIPVGRCGGLRHPGRGAAAGLVAAGLSGAAGAGVLGPFRRGFGAIRAAVMSGDACPIPLSSTDGGA